jgi:hypothetical protein
VTAAAAGRALVGSFDAPAVAPVGDGAFGPEAGPRARALLARLCRGLLEVQGKDGGFDPWPDDPGMPPVKRTASATLALAALAEGARRGAGADVAAFLEARDRGLSWLRGVQEQGGSFGLMPIAGVGQRDRFPGVEALAGGILALVKADRPEDAVALNAAVRVLGREIRGGLRNGWTRGLAAIAVDAAVAAGRASSMDKSPRLLIPEEAPRVVDCGDYRLAEAIVRSVRAGGTGVDALGEAVSAACLDDAPTWTGRTADLQSWFLQAWVQARSPRGPAWFAAVLPALEEAAGRDGRVPEGIYADSVAQTACAALVLAEGLASQPVSP